MTTSASPSQDPDFDVAVLGSGLGGSILATILAKSGVEVVLVEKNEHPRFAIGESTTPESTALLGIVAQRYSVPEIAHLANFSSVRRHVSSACGVKRNFSYAYHRDGRPQQADECTQFPTWAPPFGPDIHFFRQDTDAFAHGLAVRYGVTMRQRTELEDVSIDDSGVTLRTDRGETIRARFVVDATGFNSILGRTLDLRESPEGMMTNSRTLFTHMIDVLPYDRCGPSREQHGMPSPFHQGTLHHIFEGGWLWVIPFDNHASSTNSLCSVGLCLDRDRYPKRPGISPEQEFREVIGRFPSIAQQFQGATPVRGWVATDRMQYRSSRIAGDRYFLMPHSAGFVDPLFSSGLAFTMWSINLLGDSLIDAVRTDDFRADRFDGIDEFFHKCLHYYDRLIAYSYLSFSSFELWNAWHRVWTLGSLYGVSGQHEVFSRALQDRSAYDGFERAPYRGIQAIDLDEYRELFDDACAIMERVRTHQTSASEAATEIFERLSRCGLCPEPWKVTDQDRRCPGTFTLLPMMRLMMWARRRAPESVRANYFRSGKALAWFSSMWETQSDQQATGGGVLELWKSSLLSWNDDWKPRRARRSIWT